MKKIFVILFVSIIAFVSCSTDSLDVQPVNIVETVPETDGTKTIHQDIISHGDSVYVNTFNRSGSLYSLFYELYNGYKPNNDWGEEVWGDVKHIFVSGEIDARDFNTIKWNLRNVETVDLYDTKIRHYSGEFGTNEGYFVENSEYCYYKQHEIPIGAFFYWCDNFLRSFPEEFYDEGMHTTKKIVLPNGVKTIKRNAFARNYNLKEVNIPEGVKEIEMVAFRYCTSIEVLNLPKSLDKIGWLAFTDMYSLKEVHIQAKHAPSENQSFGNYPDSNIRGYVNVDDVDYSEKIDAVLYVPRGSKDNYKEWEKYFQDIVEE